MQTRGIWNGGGFGTRPYRFTPQCTLSTNHIGIFAICSVALASLGVDFVTSFAAVAATLGNIGPGFASVGPVENFAHIPEPGKWLLILCMLLGRLEIFTVIIFMVPEFWRK